VLGFDEKPCRLANKAELGAAKDAHQAGARRARVPRRPADLEKYTVGQVLGPADVFADGVPVDVEGTSKGKGYQGVIKRHNMEGMKATHGTHEYFRHGGSIGCRLTPQRVHKGKRMAGQMGNEIVTVQNLQVLRIVAEENCILVRGAVPGAPNGYVVVSKAATRTEYKRKGMGKEEVGRRTRSRRPRRPPPAAASRSRRHSPPVDGLAVGRRLRFREPPWPRAAPASAIATSATITSTIAPRAQGFRARAVFKLEEIDQAIHLFRPGDRVLRPRLRAGLVAAVRPARIGDGGAMVGIDRVAIPGVPGARLMVGDVFTVTSADLLGTLPLRRGDERHGARHHRHPPHGPGAQRGAVRARARAGVRDPGAGRSLRRQDVPGPRLPEADRRVPRAVRDGEGHEARVEPADLDRAVHHRVGLPRRPAVSDAMRLVIEPWGTPPARKIAKAVEILHGGGVAAYPTDSVYALGCAIEAKDAIERIARAKQLKKSQRLALICPDLSSASQYGHFNQTAFRLAQRIFPGPYTLVVPATATCRAR
jgi:large subunit ribosomal protein L3